MPGILYLVPAPLDFGCPVQAPLGQSMPDATLQVAARLDHWICENAKTARAYLKRIGEVHPLHQPVQAQHLAELPRTVHKKGDHVAGSHDARAFLQPLLQGIDMGLLSEAGMPAIADPGASVVRAAHASGIVVTPLVGPVSLLLALAASGLNGQHFAFVGYVPQDAAARADRLRALESTALQTGQSQILIETPYRNAALLDALCRTLRPTTWLSVSHGLTLRTGRTRTDTVDRWRREPLDRAPDNATPAVYVIGI